jgi:hypothetical protein
MNVVSYGELCIALLCLGFIAGVLTARSRWR